MATQKVDETELQQAAVAPRVSLQAVMESIKAEHYFTAYEGVLGERFVREKGETDAEEGRIPKTLGLLTFCVLTLKNGYTVFGHSACASPENYNKDIGQRLAKENAISQIWPLLGYELRNRLYSLGNILPADENLGSALTALTAVQMGESEALSPTHAEVILNSLVPQRVESAE